MKLFDALDKAGAKVADLKKILSWVAENAPDLAEKAEALAAQLDSPISPEALAELGAAIPGELLNISRGQLDPRNHPGDAI